MDVEKEVIQKMEKNPKIFYSHCKKFNKTSSQIGDLKTNYGVATSDIGKAEELSRQYASVWSKPSKIHCSEDMEGFFEKCKDCENQRVHICKYDDVLEHIVQYRELIMKMEFNTEYGKLSKNPQLLTVHHTYEDFEKVINKIPANAACGCDGITANLLKR